MYSERHERMQSKPPPAPAADVNASSLSDQYQKWDRFDVDAAIAKADADEDLERRRRTRAKARKRLDALDATVVEKAKKLAAAALSRARVERLRAKRGRGGRGNPQNSKASAESNKITTEVSGMPLAAEKSRLIAELLKIRAQSTEQLPTVLKQYGKESEKTDALVEMLNSAIVSGTSLLTLLPEESKRAASPHLQATEALANCSCGTLHSAQSLCIQQEQLKMGAKEKGIRTKIEEPQPDDVDMCTVCMRALNDVRCLLARVLLSKGDTSKAAGELKIVLLSDTSRACAWYYRGCAFFKMGMPLLAELHFKRADEENSKIRNPYALDDRDDFMLVRGCLQTQAWGVTEWLHACKDAVNDLAATPRNVRVGALLSPKYGKLYDGDPCLSGEKTHVCSEDNEASRERHLHRLISHAHAIFDEGYFESAALRYEAAVRKGNEMMRKWNGANSVLSGTTMRTLNVALVRALCLEAHLSIAQCHIRRKMGYRRAIIHSTLALQINSYSSEALRLRAHALMERGEFGLAIEDLRRARSLRSRGFCGEDFPRLFDSGSTISQLLSRAKHRCETWTNKTSYAKIKRQQALSRRPRSKRRPHMSIVLLIHENQTSQQSSPDKLPSDRDMSWLQQNGVNLNRNYICGPEFASNLEAIITGVHSGSKARREQISQQEVPTIAHFLQRGAGSGGEYDTAFCGDWPGQPKENASPLRGFGEYLGSGERMSSSASDIARRASKWILERENPFFITISIANVEKAMDRLPEQITMEHFAETVRKKSARMDTAIRWDDMVFVSIGLPTTICRNDILKDKLLRAQTTIYAPLVHTCGASPATSIRSIDAATSILDLAPTLLGFAGLSGLSEAKRCTEYIDTLSAYAGFRNSLPLSGRDLSVICLDGQSTRSIFESEFYFNDSYTEKLYGWAVPSTNLGIACRVESPLAGLLTSNRQTVFMCMDESCNHFEKPQSATYMGSESTNYNGLLCRYFNGVETCAEIVWFSTEEDLVGLDMDYDADLVQSLTLNYHSMKVIAWSDGKMELFDLTEDPHETTNVASSEAYVYALNVGKRLLKEARSRVIA